MAGYSEWLLGWFRPAPPEGFVFFKTQGNSMNLNGTVSLSAPDPKVAVAKRTVTVTVNGGAPTILDAMSGHVTFACADGDQVNVSAVDTSAGGVNSAPATWGGVAHDSLTVPASPTLTVSFAPAA